MVDTAETAPPKVMMSTNIYAKDPLGLFVGGGRHDGEPLRPRQPDHPPPFHVRHDQRLDRQAVRLADLNRQARLEMLLMFAYDLGMDIVESERDLNGEPPLKKCKMNVNLP